MRFTVLLLVLFGAVTARADSPRSIATKVVRAAKWRQGQPFSVKVEGRTFETGGGLPYVVAYHRDGQGFTLWQVTPGQDGKPTLQPKGRTIREPVTTVRQAIQRFHEVQSAEAQAKQAIAYRQAEKYQSGLMRRFFEATPPDQASIQKMAVEFQRIDQGREALLRGKGGKVSLKAGTVVYVNNLPVRLKVNLTAPVAKGYSHPGGPAYIQVGNAVVRIPYVVL